MGTTLRLAALLVLALCTSQCVPPLDRQPPVRVTTNATVVQSCQFKGPLVATAGIAGPMSAVGIAKVEQRFREQAAAIGADTVYMGHTIATPYVVRGTGEAYYCGSQVKQPS